MLLGNKTDSIDNRKISFNEGKEFADKHNYAFMEVSCCNKDIIRKAVEIAIGLAFAKDKHKENSQKKPKIFKIKKEELKLKKSCY